MKSTFYHRIPIGIARLSADGGKISEIALVSKHGKSAKEAPPVLKKCACQLDEFFKGKRKGFSLPLALAGTSFQKRVWRELLKIPYGKTISYFQVAKTMGKAKSVRAVANAVGANPACVVVPCHRVIGSDGSLTGYAYGLAKKSALLQLEGVVV